VEVLIDPGQGRHRDLLENHSFSGYLPMPGPSLHCFVEMVNPLMVGVKSWKEYVTYMSHPIWT
jgi:hypothetical protein